MLRTACILTLLAMLTPVAHSAGIRFYTGNLSVGLTNETMTVQSLPGFTGFTELVVIASDGEFAARGVINVRVLRGNSAPELTRNISDIASISPVSGITAISPARIGILRATPAQILITHTLINSLITNFILIDEFHPGPSFNESDADGIAIVFAIVGLHRRNQQKDKIDNAKSTSKKRYQDRTDACDKTRNDADNRI